MALASLSPGVIPQDVAPGTAVQMGNSVPGVNGANISSSAVTVDGGGNSTPRGTSYMSIYSPNVDSVAEFRVQTNSMSAEFGRTNGGSISMITKSGTNQGTRQAYWSCAIARLTLMTSSATGRGFRWERCTGTRRALR